MKGERIGGEGVFEAMRSRSKELGIAGLTLIKLLEAGNVEAAERELGEWTPDQAAAFEAKLEKMRETGKQLDGKVELAGFAWEIRGVGKEAKHRNDDTELMFEYSYEGGAGPEDDIRIFTTYNFEGERIPSPTEANYAHVAKTAKFTQHWTYGGDNSIAHLAVNKKSWDAFRDMTVRVGEEMDAKADRLHRMEAGTQVLLLEGVHSTGLGDEHFDALFHGEQIAKNLRQKEKVKRDLSWDLKPSLTVQYQRTPHNRPGTDDRFPYSVDPGSTERVHRGQPDEQDIIFKIPADDDDFTFEDGATSTKGKSATEETTKEDKE